MDSESENRPVFHTMPSDSILAALGAIAIHSAWLDNQLRYLVGDLTGVSKIVALDATDREGAKYLRQRVKALAKKRFSDGPAFVSLQALLERAARVAYQRNQYIHSVWGKELDGDIVIRDSGDVLATTSWPLTIPPMIKPIITSTIDISISVKPA
jgi:hypothetical protein